MRVKQKITNFQKKLLYYFISIFFIFIILDILNIFPYGIGRIPIEPKSNIPGIKYLYAIGFSYIFSIIMAIINPKRTFVFLLALPPIILIYKIIKKLIRYYKK